MSDEAGDETRRRLGPGRLKTRLERGGRGVRTPVRRRHSLNPSALLIDQNGRVGAPDAVPERPRQRAHLIGVADVALEENEAPRILPAQEGAFLLTKREARAAADEGLGHFRLRGQR